MITFLRYLTIALLATVFSVATPCHADVDMDRLVVVTSIKNPISSMEKEQLIDLFMGKYVAFPNGTLAAPLDVGGKNTIKSEFYRNLVGLPLARVNSYWSRLKFTGSAIPPEQVNNIEEIQRRVEQQSNVVAYLYQSQLTENMKVVYQFEY
ncbi:hypothetical protein N9L48_02970 [Psychrosphaera sp.]|nr:hypothetical protein [Psychrosphaera sp.]